MPVGYLVGVIVVAIPTLFALVPLRSVPNLSFRLGLLLNEVPIIGFYWLLFDTALAFAQGDINTAGGWATVGLAAVITAGLAAITRRQLQARPVLERAMAEALGPAGAAPSTLRLAARAPPASARILPPLSRRRHDVERVRHSLRQRRPPQPARPVPAPPTPRAPRS